MYVRPVPSVTAKQNTQADETGANHHHCGIDRIARQDGHLVTASDHHGKDERSFNRGHGQGKNQRAKGLTDAMRNDFGVVDGQQHRTHEGGRAQHGEKRTHAGNE
jgi:hypothetical protein